MFTDWSKYVGLLRRLIKKGRSDVRQANDSYGTKL